MSSLDFPPGQLTTEICWHRQPGGVRIVRQNFLHCVSRFIDFSQAISRPRQIVQDQRIVCALAHGFLQKAV